MGFARTWRVPFPGHGSTLVCPPHRRERDHHGAGAGTTGTRDRAVSTTSDPYRTWSSSSSGGGRTAGHTGERTLNVDTFSSASASTGGGTLTETPEGAHRPGTATSKGAVKDNFNAAGGSAGGRQVVAPAPPTSSYRTGNYTVGAPPDERRSEGADDLLRGGAPPRGARRPPRGGVEEDAVAGTPVPPRWQQEPSRWSPPRPPADPPFGSSRPRAFSLPTAGESTSAAIADLSALAHQRTTPVVVGVTTSSSTVVSAERPRSGHQIVRSGPLTRRGGTQIRPVSATLALPTVATINVASSSSGGAVGYSRTTVGIAMAAGAATGTSASSSASDKMREPSNTTGVSAVAPIYCSYEVSGSAPAKTATSIGTSRTPGAAHQPDSFVPTSSVSHGVQPPSSSSMPATMKISRPTTSTAPWGHASAPPLQEHDESPFPKSALAPPPTALYTAETKPQTAKPQTAWPCANEQRLARGTSVPEEVEQPHTNISKRVRPHSACVPARFPATHACVAGKRAGTQHAVVKRTIITICGVQPVRELTRPSTAAAVRESRPATTAVRRPTINDL